MHRVTNYRVSTASTRVLYRTVGSSTSLKLRIGAESTTEIVAASSHSGAVLVLTTIGVGTAAATLARTLVAERLAACVNLLPVMTSVYRWEGRVEEDQEQQIVIKTAEDRVEALIERLHRLHPYAVPELLVIQASDGSEEYLRWIRDSVRSGTQAALEESQDEKASDEKDKKQ